MTVYFHGGAPGLKPGGRLLPSSSTGARHTMPDFVTDAEGAAEPWLRYRHLVYATVDIEVAVACAAIYPNGAVYRVQVHDPRPDPDNARTHVCGPTGTILAVEYPEVPLCTQEDMIREVLKAVRRGDVTPQIRKALWAMRAARLATTTAGSRQPQEPR
ncbi:hypothetical protein [Streptomyces sp. NPDC085479]|uniref:hypothetical protein n=1 Tax=Streptomyces sp. NPDC085479 TaxID=3365726 RepID=UPI0037CE3042